MRFGILSLLSMLGLAVPCPADSKPITLFNGSNLAGWKLKDDPQKSHWTVARVRLNPDKPSEFIDVTKEEQTNAALDLVNIRGGGVDIFTDQQFGDCTVELEFMVPKGSNSGVYMMGEYEVQVYDSYGREKLGMGDLGAIYGAAAPQVNAARKPGEWQKFVIEFEAPKFENSQKTVNARFVNVTLNGQVLHENVEMKGPTPGGLTGKESPTGPLMLQGDHGPVAYRNIKITPR
jgi:hypothetical protein